MILKKRVFFKNLRGLERICEGTARVSARVKAQCLRHPEGCEGKIRKKNFLGGGIQNQLLSLAELYYKIICLGKDEKELQLKVLPRYLIRESEWSGLIVSVTLAGLPTKSLIR